MSDAFRPYGIVSTEYILPAAAIISCGARLHDFSETGEEPCIRKAIRSGDRTDIKTLFQFHEITGKGERVRTLLSAYKQLDFGQPCGLPDNHILISARKALVERNRLHLIFQEKMREPVSERRLDAFGTTSTPLAATLCALGHRLLGSGRVTDRSVIFYFSDDEEIRSIVEAFAKPWGEYDLDEDHPIYHMRGALENRESLIVLLKNASVRVEVKQNGKRFFLPLNASTEKLSEMISKLDQ